MEPAAARSDSRRIGMPITLRETPAGPQDHKLIRRQPAEHAELNGIAEQPALVSIFNATNLDVVTIRTDDIELIEEMFSRLNEAVPLNAAEKRNAFGGPCPRAVRELSKFIFTKKLPFKNSRYRHYDLAAKFLYWENQLRVTESEEKSLRDVKKYRLDTFFREMKEAPEGEAWVAADQEAVKQRLDTLTKAFVESDYLLASIGMVSVYFLLAQKRAAERRVFPRRNTLIEFENGRSLRRMPDEDELGPGQYQLLEFNCLAQSPQRWQRSYIPVAGA